MPAFRVRQQNRIVCAPPPTLPARPPLAPSRRSGIGLDEGRSRCVVTAGWRFAGAGKAGMGGRVGRDRTGPAIRPGGLAG
jgi:hypothetical protein